MTVTGSTVEVDGGAVTVVTDMGAVGEAGAGPGGLRSERARTARRVTGAPKKRNPSLVEGPPGPDQTGVMG